MYAAGYINKLCSNRSQSRKKVTGCFALKSIHWHRRRLVVTLNVNSHTHMMSSFFLFTVSVLRKRIRFISIISNPNQTLRNTEWIFRIRKLWTLIELWFACGSPTILLWVTVAEYAWSLILEVRLYLDTDFEWSLCRLMAFGVGESTLGRNNRYAKRVQLKSSRCCLILLNQMKLNQFLANFKVSSTQKIMGVWTVKYTNPTWDERFLLLECLCCSWFQLFPCH